MKSDPIVIKEMLQQSNRQEILSQRLSDRIESKTTFLILSN